ncbi:MAG: DUF2892 domain-containing protein [Rhodopseudomonas sp.]|uniref:rhodanese-like domain-containing protein n=1 Tax=Rhodopseudomonas sp. TaxID=1078 RepID=UPI00180FAA2D|nr:rhodanese-like domain-containing protein [Rhodopseudomonas sp.]NVN85967.1 DUF2892 domain-containing protein [Rhodopseudomonas sp.]
MPLPHISAAKAKQLVDRGAVLIDIRELSEHTRSRIDGAQHAPLSRLAKLDLGPDATTVIFHCRSGYRTASNADRLAQSTDCEAFILDGGIDAWKGAGLPIVEDRRQPMEMMRQVQIVSGLLVLAGALLGALVNPGFYLLSGLVGAGQVFSGVSGACPMARLLARAPWNRSVAAPVQA